MDKVIVPIIAGVVVTTVGAILAFYFGGVREKKNQEYERQRKEQERQEEKRKEELEQQRELNNRRFETLTEIRTQASSLCSAAKDWADRAARLPEKMPPDADKISFSRERAENWLRFHQECARLLHEKDTVLNAVARLRQYYWSRKRDLEDQQRDLFDSFAMEFDSRVDRLSSYLDEVFLSGSVRTAGEFQQAVDETVQEYESVRHDVNTFAPFLFWEAILVRQGVGKFVRAWKSMLSGEAKRQLQRFENEIAGLPAAAQPVRDWNLQMQIRAFDDEVERLAHIGGSSQDF